MRIWNFRLFYEVTSQVDSELRTTGCVGFGVWNSNSSADLLSGPLHLPVVRAASQRLPAEDLPPEVEALRMIGRVEVFSLQCGLTTSVRQLQVSIHRVGIHGGFETNWRERSCFGEHSLNTHSTWRCLCRCGFGQHSHFSISALVFGCGLTRPTVVTGGPGREIISAYQIND